MYDIRGKKDQGSFTVELRCILEMKQREDLLHEHFLGGIEIVGRKLREIVLLLAR